MLTKIHSTDYRYLRKLIKFVKLNFSSSFFFTSGSIEDRMVQWFQKASNTIVSNISIDAIKHIQDFEVSYF
jgi:hypothetical protein